MVRKKLANTPRQARQFIVHKHITIDDNKVNIPSYIVKTDEEDKINLIVVRKEKPKKKELIEEIKQQGVENA